LTLALTNPSVLSLTPHGCNAYSPIGGKRPRRVMTGSAAVAIVWTIKPCDMGKFSGLTRCFMLYSAKIAAGARPAPAEEKTISTD
ncbi:hypothetical protein, partial [Providencia heimbachae]|uniref:hypothetical protein n=1 Tax=Providencia heimbachae TaxID=333962 RepID=UPI00223EF038